MSSSTVRVYTAPTCPYCGKQSVYIVDNPYSEVIERMDVQSAGVLPSEYAIMNDEIRLPRWWDLKFKVITGKSGNAFLVPDPLCYGASSYIFVTESDDWNKRGEGFGGSTLTFNLSDGNTFDLRGGWHTNPSQLLHETGLDLLKKSVTFVALSRGADYNQTRLSKEGREIRVNVMRDLVYKDPDGGMEGYFMRGKHLAVAWANEHNEAIFAYSCSDGGSSFGRVKPGEEIRDPEDMW